MSARRPREREALKSAMDAIVLEAGLCADCDTTTYHLRWDEAEQRWKVDTSHPPACMVRRSHGWFERIFASRLRALLMMHGIPLSDYCDDPVGKHCGK